MAEISGSSRLQSNSLTEINEGMKSLDQVTQHNVAMDEENTAAARLLKADANGLSAHVGRFKTADREVSGQDDELVPLLRAG